MTVWGLGGRAQEFAERLVGGSDHEWDDEGRRSRFLRSSVLLGQGVRLFQEPKAGGDYCSIQVEGSGCAQVDWRRIRAVLLQLEERWRVSRLDLAIDHAPFTPLDLWDQLCAGNFRSRVHRDQLQIHGGLPGVPGTTVYLGSRTSERFGRVYDRRGFTRFELELKDGAAREAMDMLLASDVTAWGEEALAQLRRLVDFIDRSAARDISACPLLPWWAEFLAGVEKATSQRRVIRPNRERTALWLHRSVASSLAAMVDGPEGWELVHELVASGRRRGSPAYRQLVAEGRPAAAA